MNRIALGEPLNGASNWTSEQPTENGSTRAAGQNRFLPLDQSNRGMLGMIFSLKLAIEV